VRGFKCARYKSFCPSIKKKKNNNIYIIVIIVIKRAHIRVIALSSVSAPPRPVIAAKTVQKIGRTKNPNETYYFPVADVTAVAGRRADGTPQRDITSSCSACIIL